MYKVTVNVDPNQISPGELLFIVGDAVREKILQRAMEDTSSSFVKVEYEDGEVNDSRTM